MIWYFLIAFSLSIIATLLVKQVALRLKVVDAPDGSRKLHGRTVPLLGGVAIFLAFWLPVLYLFFNPIQGSELLTDKLAAALVGSIILVLVGVTDDVHPFSAKARLLFVALAILITVFLGGGLARLTNPLGGFFTLSSFVGAAIVFCWLLGMTFTTKILDGLDGLSTGITLIGSLVIFFLTQTKQFYQPNVSIIALVFAGACLGFLIFNFHPAKIFLGESGSLFLGFMLGILAVIGGGKLATALLVMALPIFDVGRVAYSRWRRGESIFKGDRKHLHFQLVDWGLSQRTAVMIFYIISLAFGLLTLFLQSKEKIFALIVLFGILVVGGWLVERRAKY